MQRFTQAVISLSLMLSVAGANAAMIELRPDPRAIEACPEYGRLLERAQAALSLGERDRAIAVLREAVGALRYCEEGTAANGPLLG